MADLPRSEAEPIIALSKFVSANLQLAPRKNQAAYLSAAARVEDEFDATIPGLTIEIEVKAALIVDACRNTVSLFQLRNGIKYRVYQIEVQPSGKRSHNEPGNTIYGPHEHRGDEAIALVDPPLDCSTAISELFALFCSRTNLSFTGQIFT